jgi:chromosome segregation ATPase
MSEEPTLEAVGRRALEKKPTVPHNDLTLNREAVTRDIEALEGELSDLRAQMEGDKSAFSTLESQMAELKENLARTLEAVKQNELRLAEKQVELDQAEREEAAAAYRDALDSRRDAADRVTQKAEDLLSELDAYDGETLSVRRLMEDMRELGGNEERIAEMETELVKDPEDLGAVFERLVGAIKWRLETVEEDVFVDGGRPIEDLSEELQDAAHARRRARIKEYFGKE